MCWWARRTSPTAVAKAVRGLSDKAANDARKKALTNWSSPANKRAPSKPAGLKCQAVTLYEGGQYFSTSTSATTTCGWCSPPKRISPLSAAIPDNFQFPRWSLDFAMLRAYENGKPAKHPTISDRFQRPASGRAGVRRRPSGHHRAAGDHGAAEIRARRVPAHHAAARSELRGRYIQFGAHQSRRPTHHRGAAQCLRERHQGPPQGARRAARRCADRRKPRRKQRCEPART
jgi:hypothetical protein